MGRICTLINNTNFHTNYFFLNLVVSSISHSIFILWSYPKWLKELFLLLLSDSGILDEWQFSLLFVSEAVYSCTKVIRQLADLLNPIRLCRMWLIGYWLASLVTWYGGGFKYWLICEPWEHARMLVRLHGIE